MWGRPSLRLVVTVHEFKNHTTRALLGRDRMVNADRRTQTWTQAERYGATHLPPISDFNYFSIRDGRHTL